MSAASERNSGKEESMALPSAWERYLGATAHQGPAPFGRTPRQNPESLSSSVDSNPQQQQQPRSPASSTDSIQSGGSTTWRSEWERFLGEPCPAPRWGSRW